MGRALGNWIVLGSVAAVTTYGTAFLMFGQIDLSFPTFATVLCATLLQAAVLAWRSAPPDAAVVLGQSVVRHPLAAPVLLLDALVLGAGIVWWDTATVGLGAAGMIHRTWTLAKSAAAVVFFARAVLSAPRLQRAAMAFRVSGPVLLIFALEPSASWLAAAFAEVNDFLGPQAEVVQRLVFYGLLFALLIAWLLRSARSLSLRSPDAGLLLQAAVAVAVVLAVDVVLAIFNLPILTQPWLGVATLLASVASTCVLLAAIVLATTARA